MKRPQTLLFGVLTATWVGALIWALYPIGPPIIGTGNDSVSPQEVEVGGIIHVTRNLHVFREESVMVIRTLIRGNCTINCEIVDLPSGNLTLKPGDYPNVLRDHILPATVQPDTWRIVFAIHWRDRIGRTHIEPLEELSFKVVAKK